VVLSHKMLGKGGFGSVCMAIQLPENRPVACKTFHCADSGELCRTEFEAMRCVREYEHVAKVVGFELDAQGGRRIYFSSCYRARWRTSSRPTGRSVNPRRESTWYESACGLESLSLEGKVHCDVKPGTMMLSFAPSVADAVPAGHAVQVAEPAAEYVPADENEPALQLEHTLLVVAPVELEAVPAAHSVQLAAPLAGPYVPAPHVRQLVDCAVG